MRDAKIADHWKTTYSRNYDFLIKDISLNGIRGIENITLNKGIFALCGLNGAGKSTIITALKDVLGAELSIQDSLKINDGFIEAKISMKGNQITELNNFDCRFSDMYSEEITVSYLNHKKSSHILTFLEQDNLEELIDQYESTPFTKEKLEEINYIIGKTYDEVWLTEIEDNDINIPYFKVRVGDIEYNSLTMGEGEHFLFYLYWNFEKIKLNNIVLLEEPETFISIRSQINLMNFIAKRMSENGMTVIVATHSPYILKRIKKDHVIIISRYSSNVSISVPKNDKEFSRALGIDFSKRGIIFVEDNVAKLFLETVLKSHSYILSDFNIEIVNGESEITKRLEFPFSINFDYKIIGMYDHDIEKTKERIQKKVNWPFFFLPTNDHVELEVKNILTKELDSFADLIGVNKSNLISILSEIEGLNYHQWLLELSKKSIVELSVLIDTFFKLWIAENDNKINVDYFLEELLKTYY